MCNITDSEDEFFTLNDEYALGTVSLAISSYTDTGFVVECSGVSEPTYVKFSYMAI